MIDSGNDVIGVVLAGGRSLRMGQDKALLDWQGISLLEHMHALLRAAGIARVLVSGQRPGYECIADEHPGKGPGVALTHLLVGQPPGQWALVVPVDMPLLTPALLGRLLAGSQSGQPAHFSHHPLPALLPTRDPAGKRMFGESIYDLHRAAGSVELPIGREEEGAFINVNAPEEWRRALVAR